MKIYPADEIRKWDAYTITNEPIASVDLMERAATLCAKHIQGSILFKTADIICGSGNNGGDGLVIARLLHQRGYQIKVYLLRFGTSLSDDCQKNLDRLPKEIPLFELSENQHEFKPDCDLIIDAIFGSGLNKPVGGWIGKIIHEINHHQAQVASVDIPSGLFADNNQTNTAGQIVKADRTFTFQCPKMAFFFSGYYQYTGEFTVVDIGLHPDFNGKTSTVFLTESMIQLRPQEKHAHKGSKGYLTLIAGHRRMIGAAILASKAALRSGCGYVGTLCPEEGYAPLMNALPEALLLSCISPKSSALAIGPGLGIDEEAKEWLITAMKSGLPLIIDADAINLLARDRQLIPLLPENTILTPHPGELLRLLNSSSNDEALLQEQIDFSIKHKVYILQKGAFSKLTTPNARVIINSTGNPAMATAGTGDALTGIIGSLLAQNYSAEEAATFGMFIHGKAGDLATEKNGYGPIITSDLVDQIPAAIAEIY